MVWVWVGARVMVRGRATLKVIHSPISSYTHPCRHAVQLQLPDKIVEDMQRQVSAERRKRASILESEGSRESAINVAEGLKQSTILQSEARRLEQANTALGEADALLSVAEATAKSIERVAQAINQVLRYIPYAINQALRSIPSAPYSRYSVISPLPPSNIPGSTFPPSVTGLTARRA